MATTLALIALALTTAEALVLWLLIVRARAIGLQLAVIETKVARWG